MDQEKQAYEIQNNLNQMPKIKDRQSKDLLFQKVENRLDNNLPQQQKISAKWFLPTVATVFIMVLLLIIVQTGLINDNHNADQPVRQLEDNQFTVTEDNSGSENLDNDQAVENFDESLSTEEFDQPDDSLIFYHNETEVPLFTIAAVDLQNMYTIPITLVSTSSTGDPNDYYNRISTIIDEEMYGVSIGLLEGITFEIPDGEEVLRMIVPEDYHVNGSSNAERLQEMANFMFADLQMALMVIETEAGESIELDPFGLSELEINPVRHLAYKIYQVDNLQRLLIPIQADFSSAPFFTIDEALIEMQQDQAEFNITATIPSDATFSYDTSNSEQLTLDFDSHYQFGDNVTTKEMIEAILMTAKSFDYTEVDLSIEGVDNVAGFDLSHPLTVPDAVNPVILH